MAPVAISFALANKIVGTVHGQGVQTLELEGITTKPAKSLDADPYSCCAAYTQNLDFEISSFNTAIDRSPGP